MKNTHQQNIFRIFIPALFTILFLLNSSINANEQASVDSVLNSIKSTYGKGKTYKIPFKQTTKYKGFKQTLKGKGEIKLSPGKAVRLEFIAPEKKVLGFNQRFYFFWNYEFKEGYRIKATEKLSLPTALTFLWGQGEPAKEYKIEFANFKSVDSKKYRVLQFLPLGSKKPFYEKFYYVIDKESYHIASAILYTSTSSIIHFEFDEKSLEYKPEGQEFVLPYKHASKRWTEFSENEEFLKTVLRK